MSRVLVDRGDACCMHAKWLQKYNEDLKGLITSEDVNVEHKGQMPRKTRNCMHILMATNNLDVLKVELSDRRYVIVHSSSEKKGDIDYFNKLAQWMDEESNQRGFYNFLMMRDVSNVHLQATRPATDMYVNAKIDSLPLVTKWLTIPQWSTGSMRIPPRSLFRENGYIDHR